MKNSHIFLLLTLCSALVVTNGSATDQCADKREVGLSQIRSGQIRDGLATLRGIVGLCPDLPRAHYNLGFGLLVAGYLPEAEQEFREAIRLNPQFERAHYQLGVTLARIQEEQGKDTGNYDWDPAIAQLRIALKLDPADADAHFDLATLLARNKAATEALKEVRECLLLRPDYQGAKTLLGAVLYMTGNLDKAIFYLRKGAAENPESPVHHDYLALKLMHMGKIEEAIDQWEVVVHLDPNYPIVHYNLARAFEKIGKKGERN